MFLKNGRFGPYIQYELSNDENIIIKKKKSKKKEEKNHKNISNNS